MCYFNVTRKIYIPRINLDTVKSYRLSFCFKDTATTEIYTYGHTLALHDALPIFRGREYSGDFFALQHPILSAGLSLRPLHSVGSHHQCACARSPATDRKSTRLNSSH